MIKEDNKRQIKYAGYVNVGTKRFYFEATRTDLIKCIEVAECFHDLSKRVRAND